MKFICVLIVITFCFSCKGQENYRKMIGKENKETNAISFIKSIDTLSVLKLKGDRYKETKYQVLKLYNFDKDLFSIEVVKNQSLLKIIKLPSVEDVKNFSVSAMIETNDGFKILTNWGGGNYFYKREFSFVFIGNEFYFSSLMKESYKQNSNKEVRTIEKIHPLIPLNKFDISLYFENE